MGAVMALCSAAQLACCCTGTACSLCCQACPSCRNSTSSRLMYALMLLLGAVLGAIALAPGLQDTLKKLPLCKNSTSTTGEILPEGYTFDCTHAVGYMAVYRINFALVCFFALMGVIMIGVKSSRDARAPVQNGLWGLKFIICIGVAIAALFIPDGSFGIAWMWVGLFGGLAFILVQLVLIIDFAHSWAETWVANYEETESKGWYCALLNVTFLQFALSLAGITLLYIYFTKSDDCALNKFFISINLIFCIIISIVSIIPQVQEALPRSGLLQSSMVTLYTVYLTWSAVANSPDKDCNPGFLSIVNGGKTRSVNFDTTSIIGLVLWMLCVLYSSLRSASAVAQVAMPDAERQATLADEEAKPAAEDGKKVWNNEESGVAYSWSLFHVVFATATFLTEDISVFASSIAHLYSHLTKPCFDLMLIGLALMRSSQKMKANIISGPLLAFVVISTTAHILRIVSPKFGQLVSEEANRYGYLRHIHSRIITNAEEIAFYGGHKVELIQLREAYNRLVSQMNTIFSQKLWFVMLEQFFMKYVWSGTGMVMVSLPILTTNKKIQPGEIIDSSAHVSERTQYLTTARNLLLSGADAIERLMSSYKEIVALAGYTHRVAGMLEVFEETACGRYSKANIAETNRNAMSGVLEFRSGQPVAKGKLVYSTSDNMSILLKNVPVVTPNCDIVVPSLTLSIEPGMHLLITGPNGCGKSSLFRILSGLWPIYGGELHIPKPVEGKPCMFYIPQRPYMSIGSLCDQIIYPDTREDMIKKNITESQLKEILKMVALEHIAARDRFDVVKDWKDILSGGEKQRMAIARLFYHKPKYALLDECTSAVSIDVESKIYNLAKSMGITLLTITHRPTLWQFHTHILEFDGQGSWKFEQLNTEENNYKNCS